MVRRWRRAVTFAECIDLRRDGLAARSQGSADGLHNLELVRLRVGIAARQVAKFGFHFGQLVFQRLELCPGGRLILGRRLLVFLLLIQRQLLPELFFGSPGGAKVVQFRCTFGATFPRKYLFFRGNFAPTGKISLVQFKVSGTGPRRLSLLRLNSFAGSKVMVISRVRPACAERPPHLGLHLAAYFWSRKEWRPVEWLKWFSGVLWRSMVRLEVTTYEPPSEILKPPSATNASANSRLQIPSTTNRSGYLHNLRKGDNIDCFKEATMPLRTLVCVFALTILPAVDIFAATPNSRNFIEYGQEFWKTNANPSSPDIPIVIDRVRHAMRVENGFGVAVAATFRSSIFGNTVYIEPISRKQSRRTAQSFRFETISITTGNRELIDEVPNLAFIGNTAQGALSKTSGPLIHYETCRNGVQATWVLFDRLVDPIVIRVRVAGYKWTAHTANGNHFRSEDGQMMKIGNVVVIDATGRSWRVSQEVQGDIWQVVVPSEILKVAQFPVAVDPLISPEFDVDAPMIVGDPADQYQPAIASNGRQFLVVWSDAKTLGAEGFGIFGTRVLSNGVILDPSGIAISRKRYDKFHPSVAACGTNFLVVWQQTVLTNGGMTSYDIFGTRVTDDGTVLDPSGISICTALNEQRKPEVCASSNQWLVVWEDGRNSPNLRDVYGARVDTGGGLVDGEGFAVAQAPNQQFSPAVASDGNSFIAVWEDLRTGTGTDIRGSRITANGTPLDPSSLVICGAPGEQRNPSVVRAGSLFLVCWEDGRNGQRTNIFAGRVEMDGRLTDGDGFPISTVGGIQKTPKVADAGTFQMVVWADGRNGYDDIYCARVTGDVVLDVDGILVCGDVRPQSTPVVAAHEANCFIVWEDERALSETGRDIYGAVVTQNGAPPLANVLISTDVNEQMGPAVAFNGTEYLVAWSDNRGFSKASWDIYGARVSRSGEILDPNGILICSETNEQNYPSVGASGGQFLVAWADHRATGEIWWRADVYAARVSNGQVLDTNGLAIQTDLVTFYGCSVAGSETGYLIVWRDYRAGGTLASIYGNIVRTNGAVGSSAIPIAIARGDRDFPCVASNGRDYLVAFADDREGPTNQCVYATRVSSEGVLLGNNFRLTTRGRRASAASDGTDYFVVWSDSYHSFGQTSGTRVLADGTVANPDGVMIRAQSSFRPAVAANGTHYFVIWLDDRTQNLSGPDVYGTVVSREGVVLGESEILIKRSASYQLPVSVAGNEGRFIVVEQGFSQGTTRVVANLISLQVGIRPVLRLNFSPEVATIEWNAESGATYHVQYKADLVQSEWNFLREVVATSASASASDTNVRTAPVRFYRVQRLP